MPSDNSRQVREEPCPVPTDRLAPLSDEIAAATIARLDAERRADELSEELAAIRSGLGWRALASYRWVARMVAPRGSRRGQAYDLVVGAARRAATGRRPDGAVAARTVAEAPVATEPAADEAADLVGPPGANTWFRDHYDEAATEVVEFLAVAGITLEGKQVADIGAGDGILDLGLVHKGRPDRLVAFDLDPTRPDDLLAAAVVEGVCQVLPSALEFVVSEPTRLPAEDGSFDVVLSWSAFEHIADPLGVLQEARRVLRDDGFLFLQVWPFYHSQFGSHLRDWFPDGWEQLGLPAHEIEAIVRASDAHAPGWADVMLREFGELNKVTVDDLGVALTEAGFDVRRLSLITRAVPVPPKVASRHALSALGIEGVELLAVPLPR